MSKPRSVTTPEAVLTARAEASAWITRLHGPNRSPEMEAGFRRWLAERPENAEEFEGLTEVWDLVGSGQAARGVPRLERWEHSEEARELKALRAQVSRDDRCGRRSWAYAALILLTCGLLAFGAYHIWWAPSYSTDIGEQRILQLADNTRVSLNSNTQLVIAYRQAERRVYVKRGEAFFEVTKDPGRPFIVVAGDRQVTALGTAFVVRYEPDRTAVTLLEGKVIVALLSASGEGDGLISASESADSLDLIPGQRVTFAKSATPKIDTPRIEAVTAWRRGEVVLDDTALADAIAEMNRYDKTRIVIDDPEIAGLVVSGLYHTGDSEGFARSIAKMYRLNVTQADGQIHLSR